MENSWLYHFKRKIIAGLVLLLLLSTLLSMLYISVMTRNYLLQGSATNSRELAGAISSSLHSLMLKRSVEDIQATISNLGKNDNIARIIILDKTGRIAFSSDEIDNGRQLDISDASCRGCHSIPGKAPATTTSIFAVNGKEFQRCVTVIYNEPACFGCHAGENRINGKLIIDSSLTPTYTLINRIRLVIMASGALCLLFIFLAIPYLSRSIDRYIEQVNFKSNEISMIYSIIESVSRSIDLEDLKNITMDIVGKTFLSDDVTIVLPMKEGSFRVINRSVNTGESRRLLVPDENLSAAIKRWQAGEITALEVNQDRSTAYLPIARGETPLALIEVNATLNPFSADRLKFMEAVSNPIAIAFENARLYTIAITDELTGLYTVRHFRSCLDRQRDLYDRHGEKFALILIDIDNFKAVNDTYGHPVGDSVLKKIGRCIADAVRESDLVFRYGGEEFTVLLPHTGENGGLQVAERIRAAVEAAETEAGGAIIKRTISLGLALFPGNARTIRELVVEADAALYRAKHSGKNCVIRSEHRC